MLESPVGHNNLIYAEMKMMKETFIEILIWGWFKKIGEEIIF